MHTTAAVALLATAAALAAANEPIVSQPTTTDDTKVGLGWYSHAEPRVRKNYKHADDFILTAPAEIGRVVWWGQSSKHTHDDLTNFDSFQIEIFEAQLVDDQWLPGTLVASQTLDLADPPPPPPGRRPPPPAPAARPRPPRTPPLAPPAARQTHPRRRHRVQARRPAHRRHRPRRRHPLLPRYQRRFDRDRLRLRRVAVAGRRPLRRLVGNLRLGHRRVDRLPRQRQRLRALCRPRASHRIPALRRCHSPRRSPPPLINPHQPNLCHWRLAGSSPPPPVPNA